MINIQDKKDCCGCSACVQKCPKHCISMQEDKEGFLYPKINLSLCIDCGLCEKVCPVLNQNDIRKPIKVYAAKNPCDEIRIQSSSGGIFTMLAEQIIKEDGVVFGARFDEYWNVIHDYTDNLQGIEPFRSSKYLQSQIGNSYRQAECFLKEGRKVLFSGTPCQISGLKHFLRKDYDNLFTVEVFCHGVPSPGIWRDYLTEFVKDKDIQFDAIKSISFRNKSTGWKNYSFVLSDLSKTYKEKASQNIFMKGFLADFYLRPSCHDCPAKSLKSGSDFTIGDFWGIQNIRPDFDDDKGVSAILINSKKGLEIFQNLSIQKLSMDYNSVFRYNPALELSASLKTCRGLFYDSKNIGFNKTVQRLTRISYSKRLFNLIVRILRKLKYLLTKNNY